jgi:hypothetical protein
MCDSILAEIESHPPDKSSLQCTIHQLSAECSNLFGLALDVLAWIAFGFFLFLSLTPFSQPYLRIYLQQRGNEAVITNVLIKCDLVRLVRILGDSLPYPMLQ